MVESTAAGGGPKGTKLAARLMLVDLAGSEGFDMTSGLEQEQARLEEGKKINQSLLALQQARRGRTEGHAYERTFRSRLLLPCITPRGVAAGAAPSLRATLALSNRGLLAPSPAHCKGVLRHRGLGGWGASAAPGLRAAFAFQPPSPPPLPR